MRNNAGFEVRAGHSMFVLDNRLYVMGGTGLSILDTHEDVWSTSNGVDWETYTKCELYYY